ncbi:hypothetical protein A9K97_gp147 [Tokyovirus A1]|uniref:hypothetical protein n=1 Tax=Tokyovirus A1 TaxID=1826170 RepID=UPI0007A96B28|nr:hypothetical protein A9K97_gp147 [Tokyovirus A1]BAU80204.1 hypothetical protein [Tokyovirus A1]
MRCTSLFSEDGTSTFVVSKGESSCRISWVVGREEYEILREFVDGEANGDANVSGLVFWLDGEDISVGADNRTHSFDEIFDKREFLRSLDKLLNRHKQRFLS